jgi:hypothetical protein
MIDQVQDQPKYLTHEDLNGALSAQNKRFEKLIATQAEQQKALIDSITQTFGPKEEKQALPSKAELSEDTASLKRQVQTLLERDKQRDTAEKAMKLEKSLRDTLAKHGINSRSDLAVKYLQDQVSYDEDGSLVMKFEAVPGVVQPMPLHEAVAKFAQTDQGKFLADPKDTRGSGSNKFSATGRPTTVTQQVTGNEGLPMFKDAKSLRAYAAGELGKSKLPF